MSENTFFHKKHFICINVKLFVKRGKSYTKTYYLWKEVYEGDECLSCTQV